MPRNVTSALGSGQFRTFPDRLPHQPRDISRDGAAIRPACAAGEIKGVKRVR